MRYIAILALCLGLCIHADAAYNVSNTTAKALEFLQAGNQAEAVKHLKSAAAVNDISAQYYMAHCYELGIGVPADLQTAFNMYRRAAERGLPDAMRELSRCYREGIGVTPNDARADEWHNRYLSRNDGNGFPDFTGYIGKNSSGSKNTAAKPKQVTKSGTSSTPKAGATKSRPAQSTVTTQTTPTHTTSPTLHKSDVDVQIPMSGKVNENVFALIIANENYQDVAPVPNALNDGEVMAQYCRSTLGLPSSNIHLVKDATLNNIKRNINLLKQIGEAYNGNASFIVYYAGHGLPEESTRNAFLLPVDGYGSDLSTCYSLESFYDVLGNIPSKKTVIILDACFSGSTRGDGMLASARGVAMKPKTGEPSGNTIVLSSAQGDETAYPYDEKRHGLFTYFLLKKMKETRGEATLGSIMEYVKDNVRKKSLVVNGKSQTPTAVPSHQVSEKWSNWKLY